MNWMYESRKYLFGLLSFLLAGMAAFGQSSAPLQPTNAIKLTLRGNYATLSVQQGARLGVVLQAFCDKTQTSCDLPTAGLDDVFPSVTIEGTLAQVIDKLLGSTKLSYTFLAPGSGQPGKLIVIPSTDADRPPFATSSQQNMVPDSSQGNAPMMSSAPESSGQGNPGPATATAVAQAQQDSDYSSNNAQAAIAPLPADGVAPSGMNIVPFPGSDGKLQMQAVSYETPSVAPFAGPDGKLVPVHVTNAPPSVIPFADAHGNLLPAPPIVQNQKLEYPIPPTSQR